MRSDIMGIEDFANTKVMLKLLICKIKDLNNRVERLETDIQKVIENMENK